ncbi:S41 family peptidase [Chitinophaga agrisoli]|nr:S41 family peptidase [Chitinophaga agrisoli]
MYRMQQSGLLITAALFSVLTVFAQEAPLNVKEINPAVEKIAAQLRAHYVFEDKGHQIAAAWQEACKKGALDQVRSWQAFDSIGTRLLRSIGHDRHLYVRYDPALARSLQQVRTDTSGEPEEDDALFFEGPAARDRNYGFEEVRILPGNLGYIKLTQFNISVKSLAVAYAAMQLVANTRALIIDLRENHGGGSNIGPVMESYFLPANKPLLEIKNRAGNMETLKTVPWLTQDKYKGPLYILVSKTTASAAEAFTYTLQASKRATVVGQRSAGAANMNTFYPVNDHVYVSISTAAPTLPGTHQNWEQEGVQPDLETAAGQELQAAEEAISKAQ